ncbi:Ubiquinone biosynthesis hydroxylase, UbiH/UbiF/VisC/COQ6 family [Candidatus Accumulibacter aalborgensis]|uniref:Ubiquinone biosynthesis hydroxylase, UbiH/UbiF/VisC/COQ6 family n=1 Tax=Candidatus Accumulibacter aalborgensis TaxID=1860102 RepID=A0A1A8XUN6_9PROT|nr:UbiH/UbiF family hydroxylase [Candidatus Accumulibacter aalborgensis]SBT08441.1 Ubiquinone biosynthesis hydroxylase, UbiH/UbiF/VisC/COQ6 family [Candidatus Accumulibacter aalborgensis]
MQPTAFDVLIVGGGLAGLSLACALRDTRLRVALVEHRSPSPSTGWDARVYAVSPVNARFLQEIGAWKHMAAERIEPIHAMKIFADDGAELDFSAYESGIAELGWILESSLMACELWENVKRQGNLTLFCPAAPQALQMNAAAAVLTLADGRALSARLLIGADGRDSWVREALAVPAINTPYGELGLVANFECQRPHRGIARQWFRVDGVLAWLPMAGDRISIVWSTADENARTLLAMAADELCARVAAAGNHELGALKLLTPAAAFPLSLLQVPRIVAPRLALVGDAAHGIHPLSGHGINLGYRDAKALADLLAATPDWQDIGNQRLLSRYQRERREETLLLQTTTHALHQLFRNDFPGLKPLRKLGMNLTNGLPLLKNLLVRYAIGGF